MSQDYTTLVHTVKNQKEYDTELCGIMKLYLEKDQPIRVSYNCRHKRNCFQVKKSIDIEKLGDTLMTEAGMKIDIPPYDVPQSTDIFLFKHDKHKPVITRMKSEDTHPITSWLLSWLNR